MLKMYIKTKAGPTYTHYAEASSDDMQPDDLLELCREICEAGVLMKYNHSLVYIPAAEVERITLPNTAIEEVSDNDDNEGEQGS